MKPGRLPAVLVAVLVAVSMTAVATPAPAQREIDGLLQGLEQSGCRFQRNGRWYGGDDARRHLQRKYDYLRKHDLVATAEQFIAHAASRSSVSGKPYRVACAGVAEQDAAAWFLQQLQQLRESTH